nr:hypothetical protein [uncultured archaeon]
MAKRAKRLEKGIESLKKQIEEHFDKLNNDIKEKNMDRGRYHANEIDKNLISALERKIEILGSNDDSVKKYRENLNKIKKEFGLE